MNKRIEKVQELLEREGLDSLIIMSNIDTYYLTGLDLSLAGLLITKESATLFVDGRYLEASQKKESVPVQLSKGFGKESAFITHLLGAGPKVGFDADTMSYSHYLEFEKNKKNFELVPLQGPIRKLRQIKDSEEKMLLREAAALDSEGYDYLLTQLNEGMTEKDAALALELYWKKQGGEKLAFEPIIAFGANSSQPHYRAGEKRLSKGDLVLIDIGVVKNHYYSDMTRVVSFNKIDPFFDSIYAIVKKAQEEALKFCSPGKLMKEVDRAARKVIDQAGYHDFFTHALGHGLGLEIHEYPTVKEVSPYGEVMLEPGMVFTIEPGIYLPGRGGIRLEDTIIITETGYENITQRPLGDRLQTI